MTTTKFTEAQRAEALEILTDNGDLDIMPVEKFMTAYEPYEIARMVHESSLHLDHAYVRVNLDYTDTHEADNPYSLVSDNEVEEALGELQ